MHLSDDFFNKWSHIVNEVNKTNVPIECIKKITIRLYGGKRKSINISTLRKQGLEVEEIETVVNRTLIDLGDEVRDVDFILDINAVADIIQPETDKLLNGL
jgi:hypothetical protein